MGWVIRYSEAFKLRLFEYMTVGKYEPPRGKREPNVRRGILSVVLVGTEARSVGKFIISSGLIQ
ncbi:MAG: hypothetical protein LBO04_04395, partial [Spirochaetaceae bacterium]|nr:hypothetical protein [Spirochaetaceae bacterium]